MPRICLFEPEDLNGGSSSCKIDFEEVFKGFYSGFLIDDLLISLTELFVKLETDYAIKNESYE